MFLADISKCVCDASGSLLSFVVSSKSLDEHAIDALYEVHEKLTFSAKTVRVGVTMLVHQVEVVLNVEESLSLIPLIQSDKMLERRATLCPMNSRLLEMIC